MASLGPLFAAWVMAAAGGSVPAARMVVMNLTVEEGVSPSLARLLDEALLSELQKSSGYEVFGQSDLVSMLQAEQEKQLAGCNEVLCIAEIGGALGATRAVFGSIGGVGTSTLLNLKLVNTQAARVEGRWSEAVSGDPAALISALRRGVAELLAQARAGTVARNASDPGGATAETTPSGASAASAPESTLPVTTSAATDTPTPWYGRWWIWTIAVVIVGGGVTAAVLASQGGNTTTPNPVDTRVSVELPTP